MHYDNETQKRIDEAVSKIQELGELRQSVIDRALHPSSDKNRIDIDRALMLVDMLNQVELKASTLMDSAFATTQRLEKRVNGFDKIEEISGYDASSISSDLINTTIPLVKDVVVTTTDFANNLTSTTKDVSQTLNNSASHTANGVTTSANSISGSLVQQTANVANILTSTVTEKLDQVSKGNPKAKPTKKSMMNSLSNTVGNMISNTASTASGLVSGASSIASSIISNVGSVTSDMVGKTASKVSGLLDGISSFAKNILGGNDGEAGSKIAQSISSGGKFPSIGSLVGSIGGSLGDAVGTIGSTVGSGVSSIGGVVSGFLGGISSAIKGSGDDSPGILGSIMKGAADVAGSLVGAATSTVGSILDGAASVGGQLLSGASSVAGSLIDSATSLMSGGSGEGGGLFGAIGDIASSALSLGGDALSAVADFAGTTIDAAVDVAGNVVDAAANITSSAIDAASDLATGVIDTVGDIASGVMDAASDVVDSLFNDAVDDAQECVDATSDAIDQIDSEAQEIQDDFEDELDSLFEDEDKDDFEDNSEEGSEEDEEDSEDGLEDDLGDDSEEDQNDGLLDEFFPDQDQKKSSEKKEQPQEKLPTTPTSPSTKLEQKPNISLQADNKNEIGWKASPFFVENGILGMMHDGDQQMFNPYGHCTSAWTMYSFRPEDTRGPDAYPQIGITPSSFEALKSMDTMLNNIPYVVIKEFFFKNTASTMAGFIKKIAAAAKEAFKKPETDANSQGVGNLKTVGDKVMDGIKKVFEDIDITKAVIDIPYVLYCGLRQRMYGNTYIFPYLVDSAGSTVINSASNQSEWSGESEGLIGALKNMASNVFGMAAGLASAMTGSTARASRLFPAPTWKGPEGDSVSFQFDLILINDNIVKARNNYMCVNTIINNNRSIQKAILDFPGALYELWLPTGQRHLMCTAQLNLSPLGLNRQVPKNFFTGTGGPEGANFRIGPDGTKLPNGAKNTIKMEQRHEDYMEVIPDAYKLQCNFKSCLANNLNTSIFQYYVKMTGYNNPSAEIGVDGKNDIASNTAEFVSKTLKSEVDEETEKQVDGNPDEEGDKPAGGSPAPTPSTASTRSARLFTRAITNLVDSIDDENYQEKFDEATYNKRLSSIKSQFGEQAQNADNVVSIIRKTQTTIRNASKFLSKLYNAESNNLWYKPYAKEEYYTTMKPNQIQILRKKYANKLKQLRLIDDKLLKTNDNLDKVGKQVALTFDLDERSVLLDKQIQLNKVLNENKMERRKLVDEILVLDTDLIQRAFDEHDDTVSVKKTGLNAQIFKQVWNENIMNSYEREKLQYMTSKEKDRYLQDKISDLEKYDVNGVLAHEDWFFRVVVLDYVVREMNRLVQWFKNCSYDDFETIYRIVRKLNLLQTDVDMVYSNQPFQVNRTNLFFISEEDAKKFTKIDDLLVGNTLYELFMSQIRIKFTSNNSTTDEVYEEEESDEQKPNMELVVEQQSEMDIANRRMMRNDIVIRFWGSEEELTKAAYNSLPTEAMSEDEKTTISIPQLKNEIIELKLKNRTEEEEQILKDRLSKFTGCVRYHKERMIMEKMNEMDELAQNKIVNRNNDVNA